MNFQDLVKIESPEGYINLAFASAKKAVARARERLQSGKFGRASKSKIIETDKIKAIGKSLSSSFKKIVKAFPSYDGMVPFYKELMGNYIDRPQYKKSLGAVNWAVERISRLTVDYAQKIRNCRELDKINSYRQEYLGRASSFAKQIKHDLKYLDECRKIMRDFPAVKSMPTACICGFPNVGKSTLLSRMSTAKPEIKEYAFTTKNLNVGYIKDEEQPFKKIQLIDTPGTLGRFEKMNPIEKISYLAIKHCADVVVYIFDLTEASAPMQQQERLFVHLRDEFKGKEFVVYLSKTDMLGDKEKIRNFRKEHDTQTIELFDDASKLAEKIKKLGSVSSSPSPQPV